MIRSEGLLTYIILLPAFKCKADLSSHSGASFLAPACATPLTSHHPITLC
jgi:hypothetical protein